MGISMDVDTMESASSAMFAATNKVLALSEIGMASPSSQSQFDIDMGGDTPSGLGNNDHIVEAKPVPSLYKQKPAEKQPFQKLLEHLNRVTYTL